MDMLVLIMLALFLIIIAFSVVIYVIVRRNSVDKQFNKKIIQKVTKLVEFHTYEVPENEMRIKNFLTNFGSENIEDLLILFDEEEAKKIKENSSDKTKLQDALLVLNRMNGPMDLVFLIKKKYLKVLQ